MGCSCSKVARTPSAITILVIGLDNSGKTTLSRTINGEIDPIIVPTVGFSAPIKKQYNNYQIVFYDLGGGARIRGVWPQYFADVHGIIYVVDSSDKVRLQENQTELHNALQHPMIVGKPVLILANKADIEHALPSEAVAEALELEKLTLCRHTLIQCTAKAMKSVLTTETSNPSTKSSDNNTTVTGTQGGNKVSTNDNVTKNDVLDPRVSLGLEWLIQAIITDWSTLEERRKKEQIEHKRIEDEKRKERIRRIAEEQAEKEQQKKKQSTEGSSVTVPVDTSGNAVKEKSTVPPVPLCKVCQKDPAVRRCAAAGWEAVCDPCGTRLEQEKEKKRKQLEEEEETSATESAAVSPTKESNPINTNIHATSTAASPLPTTNTSGSSEKATTPLVAALEEVLTSPQSNAVSFPVEHSSTVDVSATPQKSHNSSLPISAHTPAASQIHQHDTSAVSPSIALLDIPTSPVGNSTMDDTVPPPLPIMETPVLPLVSPASSNINNTETESILPTTNEQPLENTILSPPKALAQEFEEVATPSKSLVQLQDETSTPNPNTTTVTALGTTDMNITHIPVSPH